MSAARSRVFRPHGWPALPKGSWSTQYRQSRARRPVNLGQGANVLSHYYVMSQHVLNLPTVCSLPSYHVLPAISTARCTC